MSDEPCGVCGGDRRIGNSFGLTTTCPSCHGSGRRVVTTGFHDVTKTKPSHHGPQTNRAPVAVKTQWPVTSEGALLATEVKGSSIAETTKAKLIQDIIDHESTHGLCTKTFIKKVRQQVRPRTA